MNNVRKLVLGSAVLALSAVAAVNMPTATAREGAEPGKRHHARGERMHGGFAGSAPIISMALRHRSELNLSTEQVATLEKIRSHFQSQVTPLHQQLQTVEKDIAGLMQQQPANLIEIKAKIADAEKLRSELRYQRVETLENGRAVLSAEQQEQLKTLSRSRHGQFRRSPGQPA
jgi:Spy/CpxP family protein refolding chaperone